MVRANKDKRLKVLLVNGSPHRSGNTFTALSEVARTLEEEGMEAEIVHVGNRPVQRCIGCYKCREKGVCVFQDETYLTLREKLAESGRSLAGCGRPANHAHAGSQHGVDAAQPVRQYSPPSETEEILHTNFIR